jgi:hypothetical protein
MTEKIKECDRKLEPIARDKYPETKLLKQVKGVGTLLDTDVRRWGLKLAERVGKNAKKRPLGWTLGLRQPVNPQVAVG